MQDTNNSTQSAVGAMQPIQDEPHKRWDDPSLWVGVSTGACRCCQQTHVLRHGLCWTCEQTRKGFVQWANDARDAFYWTDGANVFRAPISNAVDVASGYTLGRWESTVEHWNHYAKAFNRTAINA